MTFQELYQQYATDVYRFAYWLCGNSAEAVSIFRAVGDVASQVVLNLLSAIALQQGDIAAAERYALDTAAVASGTGWEASALVNLADVYLVQDELERADVTLRRAVVRALETGTENWFRMALRNIAQLALQQGDGLKAAKLIGASRRNMPALLINTSMGRSLKRSFRP